MDERAVLHLSSDLPPAVSGGRSVAVAAIVAADPRAEALRPADEPAAEAVSEIVLHDPALVDRARALADRFGATVAVYVHVVQADVTAARGGDPGEITRTDALQRAAIGAADRVIVPSRAAADALGIAASAEVRPPPVELEPRPRRGGGPVLYVGRFAWIKGTVDLLEAWPDVGGGARLHLVGGVPRDPKKDRWWRRKWADDPTITDEPWITDRAVLAERYADASVLVVPSRVETYGLVVAEGLRAGVPMVLADLNALRELAGDSPSVTWFPAGDVGALARALRTRHTSGA